MCRKAQGGKLDSAFALALYSFQHKPDNGLPGCREPSKRFLRLPAESRRARFVPARLALLAMCTVGARRGVRSLTQLKQCLAVTLQAPKLALRSPIGPAGRWRASSDCGIRATAWPDADGAHSGLEQTSVKAGCPKHPSRLVALGVDAAPQAVNEKSPSPAPIGRTVASLRWLEGVTAANSSRAKLSAPPRWVPRLKCASPYAAVSALWCCGRASWHPEQDTLDAVAVCNR
jgi:hypothetical protein